MEDDQDKKIHTDVELDFNEADLNEVAIDDTHLEQDDISAREAKREAKKNAKLLRSPEERKREFRKKALITSAVIIVLLGVLLAIPVTRWPILNTIGFRGDLVITVLDSSSKKPVIGAAVKFGGSEAITNAHGHVAFNQARLGTQQAVITKIGYGESKVAITNGLGNTKKSTTLKVIGIKLDFDIKDWLSGQPVSGAKVLYEKSEATSDKSGRASLIIMPTDEPKISVSISAPEYATKTIEADMAAQVREVSLISAHKNYFISKRDGTFSIFSSNLDGSDQQKIIEATGKESEALLQFRIYRSNKQAILVANRDGKVQNGRVVAGVYVVDLEKATLKKIDEGSDVQLLDWGDSVIAYTKTDPNVSYDNPALSHLMTYNLVNSRLAEIAASNYFAVSLVAQNKVYYLPGDAYRAAAENRVLTSYQLTSGAKQTFLNDKQIHYALRTGYGTLEVQDTLGQSYEIQLANGSVKPTDKRSQSSLSFALSQTAQSVAWVERRDGQGALLLRNLGDNKESTVVRASGLTTPVRFISESLIVVRSATSQETADYVVNIRSGKIAKIVDVSNVGNPQYGAL